MDIYCPAIKLKRLKKMAQPSQGEWHGEAVDFPVNYQDSMHPFELISRSSLTRNHGILDLRVHFMNNDRSIPSLPVGDEETIVNMRTNEVMHVIRIGQRGSFSVVRGAEGTRMSETMAGDHFNYSRGIREVILDFLGRSGTVGSILATAEEVRREMAENIERIRENLGANEPTDRPYSPRTTREATMTTGNTDTRPAGSTGIETASTLRNRPQPTVYEPNESAPSLDSRIEYDFIQSNWSSANCPPQSQRNLSAADIPGAIIGIGSN